MLRIDSQLIQGKQRVTKGSVFKKSMLKRFIYGSVFLILIYYAAGKVNLSQTTQSDKNVTETPAQVPESGLKDIIENSLKDTNGTYGIAIKNLKTGKSYYLDEHKVFESGSLYKLWVMATVYQKIAAGELGEDQVLSDSVAALNQKFEIDPEYAELTSGTITLSVKDALNQMVTISHNYAAMLLTDTVKLSTVDTFLKDTGLNESTVGINGESPTTTAADIAVFLEKLYRGELASEKYTNEMIDLLKNQQLNDGLPKYLPDKSRVANKTGDIDYFKHDAGIVYTDNGDYIIVVMSESDYPADAQEKIAQISKVVYDYFSNKTP